ncbi:DEAD/DEAH box helicase [Pseudoduganella sp. FT93W]|uniref:DEAD/DEAH box helicase n=1 Tax=Duganella fentianensis TaxID=2692177 RepID=A0A845HYC5_9BURK|nr:DEAD/DEAH box helicase [Duganella fentianensis]MYN45999.1 DEAD/DEAH box helicase [Duganella fentianensis]
MKPEYRSQNVLKITRSKGKMYEFGIDESHHIAIPDGVEPASLFLLTVGILGDYAAEIANSPDAEISPGEELQFSAKFFDAYLASRFDDAPSQDVLLLASAAYYLAERPGSSFVLAKRLVSTAEDDSVENFLRWLLNAKWTEPLTGVGAFSEKINALASEISNHFIFGLPDARTLHKSFSSLRKTVYQWGTPRNLLFTDLVVAVAAMRVEASSWELLPRYTGLPAPLWATALQHPHFPKELWPSQVLLGINGIYNGVSGLVQMPTSAGKTRSLEIILRSAFLSGRAKLAVVVVPFRALCHEVGGSLRESFASDDVKVDELSDALQMDFMAEIAEIFGGTAPSTKYILVLTPEKLLYVLRQQPALSQQIGLVAYDEGHQFDSGSRGIVYELLLTELKAILPSNVQTILISAVIKNAAPVANWLIGDGAVVVDGTTLFPTARSIAFASWLESAGQLRFFDERPVRRDKYDYFVPRVIEQQVLLKKPREKERKFPEKGKDAAKDVSLYLGISLVPQGAVAVFCGKKDTAEGMAKRIVEVYSRQYQKAAPNTFSDQNEILAMTSLLGKHFGETSYLFKAAELGCFVHHGNTPHGVRLAVEYGMQKSLLKFVICTSTLAQGVNLPIRYLIVSSIYQAGEQIKTRDFLNLIGRAGRAGMHTEGLVIFADSSVIDDTTSKKWQFDMSANLLAPEKSEDTSSSLLSIIAPIPDETKKLILPMSFSDLAQLLVATDEQISHWAHQKVREVRGFTAEWLIKQIKRKRQLQKALESYLMSNRGFDTQDEFQSHAASLAESTLAFSIATDEQKEQLQILFRTVAIYVDGVAPRQDKQHIYAKTLLGVADARTVEEWVELNRESLLGIQTNDEWLKAIWPLFQAILDSMFFHSVLPPDVPYLLAKLWINSSPYSAILENAKLMGGTRPWGEGTRKLTEQDVMEFLEKQLCFECSLIVSAVSQFLFGSNLASEEATVLQFFQKSLKYGLKDRLSISVFDAGLADRVIAIDVAEALRGSGYSEQYASTAFKTHRPVIAASIAQYPAYFKSILENIR